MASCHLLRKPVYPRWRGEHSPSFGSGHWRDGLSPLARGTRHAAEQPQRPARFIPAGAGNTSEIGNCSLELPVYPRWRGEHPQVFHYRLSQSGLSPLARGTRHSCKTVYAACRFIPAGAGNTDEGGGGEGSTTVYPRWRGEHARARNCPLRKSGLSPLARGTRCIKP